MTLEQLRVFVAVAEHEHVTRAAMVLGLTQSAASAAVAAIERRYGARLFDRVGRGIELTEAGRRFLPEARAVLDRALGGPFRARGSVGLAHREGGDRRQPDDRQLLAAAAADAVSRSGSRRAARRRDRQHQPGRGGGGRRDRRYRTGRGTYPPRGARAPRRRHRSARARRGVRRRGAAAAQERAPRPSRHLLGGARGGLGNARRA